jgi:hypothetical protein
MQWFKHDTNAINDAKLKKLIIKYGAEGYAVYFHCIELIANDINENNITFCLEHDSEIIADNLKIKGTAEKSGIQIVEEIMKYIIELRLFEEHNNLIYCFKLLKRLDTSMTSSQKFRKVITEAKENHDEVMTESCKIRLDKIRSDKIRSDKPKKQKFDYEESFNIFYDLYNVPVNKQKSQIEWKKINPEIYQEIYNHVREYRSRGQGVEYPLNPNNYLKNKRWTEGIIETFKNSKPVKLNIQDELKKNQELINELR